MTINVFGGGNTGGPAFPVQRSVRLRSSASAYFNRTPSTATNQRTWTWSNWVKRGALGTEQQIFEGGVFSGSTEQLRIFFTSTDNIEFSEFSSAAYQFRYVTTQVFRDTSAWYHIVAVLDTTDATSTNRVKLYINGVQVTSFSTSTTPTLNFQGKVNSVIAHDIGRRNGTGTPYFDGYLTEVNFIDGQALTPSSFGSINSTTGVWQPIKYSGTYGTNGFYLNFNDNSAATAAAIGKDSSGNGNNWTPNNISVTAGVTYDSMLDVPTLTSATNANFATLNPLSIMGSGNTLTNGNLTFAGNGSTNIITTGTFGISSGKWYVEATITSATGGVGFGIAKDIEPRGTGTVGNTVNTWGYNSVNGVIANNSSTLSTGATYTTNDVVAFALDMDAGTLTFYKNNAAQGSTVTGLSGTFLVAVSGYLSTINTNFGQRPFSYTPPSGFKSLNTYNLPAPTIPNGATQFAATTYTGTGSSLAISNTVNSKSFQPDLVWIKKRSGVDNHELTDSVRGNSIRLASNTTDAQSAGGISIASNGFSLSGSPAYGTDNESGFTYVGWQWKAGGTAVTNTSGTITSSVSANPGAGFSIVTYTGTASAGATVGHGLNIKPSLIIVKQRTTASTTGWAVYHSSLDSGDSTNSAYLLLNSTNAKADVTTGDAETVFGNGTVWKSPTSSVFTIGANGIVNASSGTYVSYCFSEIAGYSKFGSYTGNNATDGPFVYLGFRPRFVMMKASSAAGDWIMVDTSRDPENVMDARLQANASNEETTTTFIDAVSNGFKVRSTNANINASLVTITYAAFAESPFNYSLAR